MHQIKTSSQYQKVFIILSFTHCRLLLASSVGIVLYQTQ